MYFQAWGETWLELIFGGNYLSFQITAACLRTSKMICIWKCCVYWSWVRLAAHRPTATSSHPLYSWQGSFQLSVPGKSSHPRLQDLECRTSNGIYSCRAGAASTGAGKQHSQLSPTAQSTWAGAMPPGEALIDVEHTASTHTCQIAAGWALCTSEPGDCSMPFVFGVLDQKPIAVSWCLWSIFNIPATHLPKPCWNSMKC